MKTTSILISAFIMVQSVYAQFKLNQYGRIGIGIDPHPAEKFLIKSNLIETKK